MGESRTDANRRPISCREGDPKRVKAEHEVNLDRVAAAIRDTLRHG